MSKSLKNILMTTVILLICFYVGFFIFSALYYSFLSLMNLVDGGVQEFQQIFWWLLVGLSLSLLATLCAWPFSLSILTLIEQNRGRKRTHWSQYALKFMGSLPLVLFVFLFVEVIGQEVFGLLESFWIQSFASSNFVTQALAFALTLLLYPLTILPFFGGDTTIDQFFRQMLAAVIEFAEVGLVSSVVVLGLVIFILPQMVLRMERYLKEDANLRSLEVIQSIGGTHWESIYMTVLQSMKEHFNLIVLRFTRICFFEGLLTLSLLSFFFRLSNEYQSYWGSTLSSVFITESLQVPLSISRLSGLAGLLALCYFIFVRLEVVLVRNMEKRK